MLVDEVTSVQISVLVITKSKGCMHASLGCVRSAGAQESGANIEVDSEPNPLDDRITTSCFDAGVCDGVGTFYIDKDLDKPQHYRLRRTLS